MTKNVFLNLVLAAPALIILSLTPPAAAQSAVPSKVETSLKRQGYNRIYVIQGKRAPYKVRACLGSDRIEMNIGRNGRILDRSRIDGCLPPANKNEINVARFRADGVPKMLRREGYNRIELIRGKSFPYTVQACQGNDRIRMNIDPDGIIDRSRVDGCPPLPQRARRKTPQPKPAPQPRTESVARLDRADIEDLLRREGFDRIAIVRDRRAPYIAEACRRGDRLELTIGRRGRIRDQRRVGQCETAIDPNSLEEFLEKKGYERVDVVKRKGPPYGAVVCREGDNLSLVIGRYGKIQKEKRIGRCRNRLSEADIREDLAERGLIVLSMTERRRGWAADVCDGTKRYALRINPRGRVRREEAAGTCRSQTVLEVLKNLEDRGARRVNAFVEGCFKGDRFRWRFDRLGNRTGRERIGNC